eukprot:960758-Amphidinium_carterae.1
MADSLTVGGGAAQCYSMGGANTPATYFKVSNAGVVEIEGAANTVTTPTRTTPQTTRIEWSACPDPKQGASAGVVRAWCDRLRVQFRCT